MSCDPFQLNTGSLANLPERHINAVAVPLRIAHTY